MKFGKQLPNNNHQISNKTQLPNFKNQKNLKLFVICIFLMTWKLFVICDFNEIELQDLNIYRIINNYLLRFQFYT